jgi:hypothetical protein
MKHPDFNKYLEKIKMKEHLGDKFPSNKLLNFTITDNGCNFPNFFSQNPIFHDPLNPKPNGHPKPEIFVGPNP